MGWESPSHWVIIAVVVIVLFGYKKLPDAARALGRSLRTFKTELKGMADDDEARASAKAVDPAHESAPEQTGGGTAQPSAAAVEEPPKQATRSAE